MRGERESFAVSPEEFLAQKGVGDGARTLVRAKSRSLAHLVSVSPRRRLEGVLLDPVPDQDALGLVLVVVGEGVRHGVVVVVVDRPLSRAPGSGSVALVCIITGGCRSL